MLKSLPPLQNLFEMAGMTLPDLLDVRADKEGKAEAEPSKPKPPAPKAPKKEAKDKVFEDLEQPKK